MAIAEPRLISAETMARAVETDPQFRPPRLPKLVDGLVIVPLESGLLVEGGPERQVFRGRAASELLPQLLPLLDGTRDPDALAEALGHDAPDAARKAVALLYTCGLVEEGEGAGAIDPEVGPEAIAFISRQVDSTRINRNAAEAIARLRAAEVALLGDPESVALLATELAAAGIRVGDAPTLTVYVMGVGDEAALVEAEAHYAGLGVPLLRVGVEGGGVEIGPLFDRSYTPCAECYLAGREEPGSGPTAASGLLASLAALEVTNLLARIGGNLSVRGLARLDLQTWSQRSLLVSSRPGCPNCLPLPPEDAGPAPLALAYEQSIAFPPRKLLNPKDHQHHYRLANLELQRDAKRYPSATVVRCPDGLGGLLERAFGLRDGGVGPVPGKIQRWAPTGGNLGSPQVYVLARTIAGLLPGAYCHLPIEGELARLRPEGGLRELDALIEQAAPGALDSDPAALLVLTGALARVGTKYATFAYRIVNLDAGCALAQLRAVARANGWQLCLLPRWDDEALLRGLALDGDIEPITAVAVLRGAPGA